MTPFNERVERGARAAFMSDAIAGHHKASSFILDAHTWENISEAGRENYRRMVRHVLAETDSPTFPSVDADLLTTRHDGEVV